MSFKDTEGSNQTKTSHIKGTDYSLGIVKYQEDRAGTG